MLLPRRSIQHMNNIFPQHEYEPCSNNMIRPQTLRIHSRASFHQVKLPRLLRLSVLFTLSSRLLILSAAKPTDDDKSEASFKTTPETWQSARVSDYTTPRQLPKEQGCTKRTMTPLRTVAHPAADDEENDETIVSATTRRVQDLPPREHYSRQQAMPLVNNINSEEEPACLRSYAFKAAPASRNDDDVDGIVRRQLVENENQTSGDPGGNDTVSDTSTNDTTTGDNVTNDSTNDTTTQTTTAPEAPESSGDNVSDTNFQDDKATQTSTAPEETSTAPEETPTASEGTTSAPEKISTAPDAPGICSDLRYKAERCQACACGGNHGSKARMIRRIRERLKRGASHRSHTQNSFQERMGI